MLYRSRLRPRWESNPVASGEPARSPIGLRVSRTKKGGGPHLKRAYRAGRARLRGAEGAAIWENWAVLAYNVDTAAALPLRRAR